MISNNNNESELQHLPGAPQYIHEFPAPGPGTTGLTAIKICLEKSKAHNCGGSDRVKITNNKNQKEKVRGHGGPQGWITQIIDPQDPDEMLCADRPSPHPEVISDDAIELCLEKLDDARVWRNGSVLRVHFQNFRSSRTGQRIVSSHVQNTLERDANIKFEFGAQSNSAQIRIRFEPSDCASYSYVGRHNDTNPEVDTMNLAIRDLKTCPGYQMTKRFVELSCTNSSELSKYFPSARILKRTSGTPWGFAMNTNDLAFHMNLIWPSLRLTGRS